MRNDDDTHSPTCDHEGCKHNRKEKERRAKACQNKDCQQNGCQHTNPENVSQDNNDQNNAQDSTGQVPNSNQSNYCIGPHNFHSIRTGRDNVYLANVRHGHYNIRFDDDANCQVTGLENNDCSTHGHSNTCNENIHNIHNDGSAGGSCGSSTHNIDLSKIYLRNDFLQDHIHLTDIRHYTNDSSNSNDDDEDDNDQNDNDQNENDQNENDQNDNDCTSSSCNKNQGYQNEQEENEEDIEVIDCDEYQSRDSDCEIIENDDDQNIDTQTANIERSSNDQFLRRRMVIQNIDEPRTNTQQVDNQLATEIISDDDDYDSDEVEEVNDEDICGYYYEEDLFKKHDDSEKATEDVQNDENEIITDMELLYSSYEDPNYVKNCNDGIRPVNYFDMDENAKDVADWQNPDNDESNDSSDSSEESVISDIDISNVVDSSQNEAIDVDNVVDSSQNETKNEYESSVFSDSTSSSEDESEEEDTDSETNKSNTQEIRLLNFLSDECSNEKVS